MFIRHIAYIPGPFSCFAISLKYTIFFVITSHISHISYSVFTFCPRHHFHFSLWCAGLELECRFNCAKSFLQQAPEMRYLYGKYKVLRVWWICVIVCLTDSASDFRMTTFIYNKHRNMVEQKKNRFIRRWMHQQQMKYSSNGETFLFITIFGVDFMYSRRRWWFFFCCHLILLSLLAPFSVMPSLRSSGSVFCFIRPNW